MTDDGQKAKEPRVFWAVYEDYVEDGSYGSGAFSTHPGGNLFWETEQFPLVEKSAYDELKSLAEKMAEALHYTEMHTDDGCWCGYYGDDSEETGMSECHKCRNERVLSEYRARYPDSSDALKETKRE